MARQTADSKTEAAIDDVAWVTYGVLRPISDDAMLRLVPLALLPQIGGIPLMVGHTAK